MRRQHPQRSTLIRQQLSSSRVSLRCLCLLALFLPACLSQSQPQQQEQQEEEQQQPMHLDEVLADIASTSINNSTEPSLLPINQTLHVAGLYDVTSFPGWPRHILNFTVSLINNKTDGWHDDVLTDGSVLTWSLNNSACDPDMAVRSYLGMMRDGIRPNAIFGCRCSGASMAVARLCDVENIPMLSPASTSVKLSVKEEYSTFSRLVGPDNHMGQVGALISLLRTFGWDRISVINTDTQFTKDIALELSDAWKGKHTGDDPFTGEIAYQDTIKLNKTNNAKIDFDSARKVLNAVPVDKTAINSRIIVLFAHVQHTYPILKLAREMGFQPDTIWVGTGGWVGREPLDGDYSWMPPIPGYLGIGSYRNFTSPAYLDFLTRLQQYERENFIQPITEKLPDYVADRFVDGPLALAKAFDGLLPADRDNGERISQALRRVKFEGLSGPIAFEENGDFKDPRYLVLTMSSRGEGWLPIGFATPTHADIAIHKVCYAEVGCTTSIPDDEYPPDRESAPFWIWIIVALLVVITILLYYQRQKSIGVTAKLTRIEHELAELDNNDDAVKQKKGRLYKEIATLLNEPTPDHWTPNARHMAVEVTPIEEEYWQVAAKLRETMTPGEECHLSHLSRIQNEGIWSYYVFRKNQLANKYGTDLGGKEIAEAQVWHGTSSLNPDVIYRDQQDGFMMQLSQQGHWGRGIYFSERSGYSDPYAFKPLTEYQDSEQHDRELFLVKLLVGEGILLDRTEGEWMAEACKALVTPPDNPNFNGYKFDTVMGIVEDEAKTKVYVVYENGRAYPEYLVRYYKGDRDPERTPFESWEDVLQEKENQEKEEPVESEASVVFRRYQAVSSKFSKGTSMSTLGMESSRNVWDDDSDGDADSSEVEAKGIWQYQDDSNRWVNYLNGHQIQLEKAYQQDNTGVTTIETFPWTYAVDFSVNLQTNLDHPERKTRKIRRIHIDHLDPAHRNLRNSNSFRFSTKVSASKRRLLHPEAMAEGIIEEGEMEHSGALMEDEEAKEEEADGNSASVLTRTTRGTSEATDQSSDVLQPPPREEAPAQTAIPSTARAAVTRAATAIMGSLRDEECGGGLRKEGPLGSDESFRIGPQDAADAAAGTTIANVRPSTKDEQAASIENSFANSLASLYPSVRSVMTTESTSSLYPSFRDISYAGSTLGESVPRNGSNSPRSSNGPRGGSSRSLPSGRINSNRHPSAARVGAYQSTTLPDAEKLAEES